MNAKQIIKKLRDGNRRFVKGESISHNFIEERKSVLEDQKPIATILTCSDSRVIPEYIFDAKIGELFVVRTAGNIADIAVLGSIEYGTEHLNTPILLILGHEKCGAVTAACLGGGAHGNIEYILDFIEPACKQTLGDVEKAIDINLELVKKEILEKSNIVKALVEKEELKIIKAKYLLSTGEVVFY